MRKISIRELHEATGAIVRSVKEEEVVVTESGTRHCNHQALDSSRTSGAIVAAQSLGVARPVYRGVGLNGIRLFRS